MRGTASLVLGVLLAGIAAVSAPPAASASTIETSHLWVSYRDIPRGYFNGGPTLIQGGINPSTGKPWVVANPVVCDEVNEPQETNIVRAEVLGAFTNGSAWSYSSSGWLAAEGDGAGCRYHLMFLSGPAGYRPGYLRIRVQAPGKAEAVYRFSF